MPLRCPRGYIFSPPETRRTFYWCLYTAPGVTSSRPQKHGGLLLFLACTRSTARRSLTCLNSLDGEKDFIWCLNLPRVYISFPLDALRTFSLSLACTRSTARRSLSCLYIAPGVTSSRPQKQGGLLLFLACTRSTARRSLSASGRARALRSFIWCLRSPKDDEDFESLTGASNRRKTMKT